MTAAAGIGDRALGSLLLRLRIALLLASSLAIGCFGRELDPYVLTAEVCGFHGSCELQIIESFLSVVGPGPGLGKSLV
jgi:hypothetical protein